MLVAKDTDFQQIDGELVKSILITKLVNHTLYHLIDPQHPPTRLTKSPLHQLFLIQ